MPRKDYLHLLQCIGIEHHVNAFVYLPLPKIALIQIRILVIYVSNRWPNKPTSGHYNIMSAGVNAYFHNMIFSFRDEGALKINVVPLRLQLQRLWLLQEAPARDWQASCRWSRPSVCPSGVSVFPGDVSPSPHCNSSSALEEITGINQIGTEFIWGVAGCFVMQTTELQNNRFSF